MKLTILGTGSATPIIERRPSAALIDLGNDSLLIDCGEGTQFQFLKYKIRFSRLRYILITHLHGDHYFGLIALVNTINNTGRTEPLIIIGPKGLSEIISVQLKYSQSIINFPIDFIETNPDIPEEIYANKRISIRTFPLKHRIPCTGFVVSEQPGRKKILIDKLPKDFPIPYFKMLKDGLDVYDEFSGETFLNADYTQEPDDPFKIAYCSDTIFDESIIPQIKDSDILYHEATFINELEERARYTFHSTAAQAATIALKSGAKKLIIGHFSSRYKKTDIFLNEAKVVFEETYLAEEGKTY